MGEIARRSFTVLSVAALLCAVRVPALAETGPTREPLADETEPRSHFVAVAIVGSAIRSEGAWDRGFGGELSVGALCEGCGLAAWAVAAGFIGFSERSGGRAHASAALGTRRVTGILVGLAAGGALELDDHRRPRAGGEVTAWAFAGVIPYVRVGAVEGGGRSLDLGLRILLPAGRW